MLARRVAELTDRHTQLQKLHESAQEKERQLRDQVQSGLDANTALSQSLGQYYESLMAEKQSRSEAEGLLEGLQEKGK